MSGGVPAGEGPSTLCLACCRTLKEHGAKRQCPETTYFIANRATPTPPIEGRDADVERVDMQVVTDAIRYAKQVLTQAYTGKDRRMTNVAASNVNTAAHRLAAALQALGERG